eukprot:TRINITY_DN84961_c0_g1_i1.p1 TRINITY_DN84961_c0_g1~~TRINITY_DN84961_c0_g1_i1.p1  ORF type:complete len:532 (+),score=32.30 TRINITY_DN84961_c0_g1_i1:114-1598(+)
MGMPAWYNMEPIEQVICSHARAFAGTPFSTTSGYIERLRGYMKGGIGDPMRFIDRVEESVPVGEQYQWLDEVEFRPSPWAREYHQGWPKTPLPARRIPQSNWNEENKGGTCEQKVRAAMALPPTQEPPENNWAVDDEPGGVCKEYLDTMVEKICYGVPGSNRALAEWAPVGDPLVLTPYLKQLKKQVEKHLIYGRYVFFTMVHLQKKEDVQARVEYAPHMATWMPDVILHYATVTAHSFKEVYGKYPIFVADSEMEAAELRKQGFTDNIVIDPTPMWRGETVAGSRFTSRSTITKYFFLHFFLTLGYAATFFDTDGFWLRPLELPKAGETPPVDVMFGFEYPQEMPHRVVNDPAIFSPLDRYQQSTNWFKWCKPNSEHIAINTGLMTWWPTEKAKRLLANQIEFVTSQWNFWWEQNLLTYIHYHHVSFGFQVGYWHDETCNKYGYVVDCTWVAPRYAWVHTKEVDKWGDCSTKVDTNLTHTDVRPAPITLNLLG